MAAAVDRWDVGEARLLQLEFRNIAGGLSDPTSIVFTIRLPDGTIYDGSSSVVKIATGTYTASYTAVQPGGHIFRVVTTGNPTVVQEAAAYAIAPFESEGVGSLSPDSDVWNAIARKCAAEQSPVLTDEDLAALVAVARNPDGTFSVNRAAAEGWRWKAARVAGGFSFSADGVSVDKTMLLGHCREMIRLYQKGRVRSVRVGTDIAPGEVPGWYQTTAL
jgi:hypothetical protein